MRLSRCSCWSPVVACLAAVIVCATSGAASAEPRGLLWRVVQTCIANHTLTGAAFPCLAVDTPNGFQSGYAVLRSPTESIRIIVTPTVRTVGIESERLRGPDAPDYFHDAWAARHFATDNLAVPPRRDDLALAVNSRPGRSQDQLHIHVACIRPDVKSALARNATAIRSTDWARLKVLPGVPSYLAHFEPTNDFEHLNVFDRVAAGLKVDDDEMHDVTIVAVGAEPDGFVILARKRNPRGWDEPHGEGLLDPECESFRRP